MSDYDDGYADGRDNLYDRIEALEAERDRYRDALNEILEQAKRATANEELVRNDSSFGYTNWRTGLPE